MVKNINLEKIFSVCFIFIATILLYCSYIDKELPPILGWWNYYGWRLAEGDILYRDIYCFLPPYIPFFHMLLYCLFGNSMFNFQILGILLVIIGALLSYFILCDYIRPYYSALAVVTGTVVMQGTLFNFPGDYHTMFFLVSMVLAYSAANIYKSNYIYTAICGISAGMLLMIKQTMIVYLFLLLLWFCLFIVRKIAYRRLIKHVCLFIAMFLIAIAPAGYYILIHDIGKEFIQCVLLSPAAKGYSSGILETVYNMLMRYIDYGFSFSNITIALLFYFRYFKSLSKRIGTVLYIVIIFKLFRLILISISMNITILTIAIFVSLLLGIFPILYYEQLYEKCKKIVIHSDKFICYVLLSVILLELLFYIYHISIIYKWYTFGSMFFFLSKRALSEIAFYFTLIVVADNIFSNKTRVIKENIIIFITCMCFFQALLFAGTGCLDEIYSMPTVAFLCSVVLKNECKLLHSMALFFFSLVILVSVIQKQMAPYSWHGWQSTGIFNQYGIRTEFMPSKIQALKGYSVDIDTENAYENIVDAISIYTDENGIVYEFPHSPLFNCITERKLGTFAVAHFIDVCPDEILLNDLQTIKNNNPDMFIYVKLDEGAWHFNEIYYRNGRFSARKKVEEFYNEFIKEKYTLLYSYKNIYVWVKTTNNQQNMQYAMKILTNYADNYDKTLLKEYMRNFNINKYEYIIQDVQKWSVNDCMREIIKDNNAIYDSLTDEDYKYLINGIKNRISGVPATNASYNHLKEE